MKKAPPTLLSEPKPDVSTVRWTDEDWRLITALRKHTGILSLADLLRKALRDAAQKEGVK